MTLSVEYALDANVFIEAAQRYYAFDLAPAFWDALVDQAKNGRLCSVDQVWEELKLGKDPLSRWPKTAFSAWFMPTKQGDVIGKYQDIIAWVHQQHQYRPTAKSEFAEGADGWVVAYASVNK